MKQWSRLAVGLVFCTQVLALAVYYPKWRLAGTEALISWDVAGYYMYLPAAFVYDDLAGDSYHEAVTRDYGPSPQFDHAFRHESGAYVMKYSLGMALQYAPFFAVAQALTFGKLSAGAKTSPHYPPDGFSRPYQLAVAAEILCFALLSLVLLRRLLRHYFEDGVAAITLLGIGWATNYLEYSSMGGGHAHLNVFVYYCVLALALRRFYARPSRSMAIVIGAAIGIATLSRPTELLMVLLALAWGIEPSMAGLRARFALLWSQWPKLLLALGVGAAILSLQAFYWHSVTGDWVVYSYRGEGFSFLRPHLWRGLVSFGGGWLPYTPLGLLMLLGFVPLWRRRPALAAGVMLYTLAFMYVAWSWDQWQYGGSLGQRTMVQLYPLLALPLAALVAWGMGQNRWRAGLLAAGFGVSLLVNLFWTHQAHRGGMYHAGQMTTRFYFAQLGRFDRPRERLVLLDHARLAPPHFTTLARSPTQGFEEPAEPEDRMICGDAPLEGAGSLCVRAGQDFSAAYALPLPPATADWVRLHFNVDVREKTWDWWAMAQVTLRFHRGAEVVASHYLRPERLLDGGRDSLVLDAPLPKFGTYDRVDWQIWKPGLGGLIVVDEVWAEYGTR